MVETFKIINNIDKVNKHKITPLATTHTRGHNYKIFKRQARLNARKSSFSQRIVNNWNSLPDNVVQAETVNNSKADLTEHGIP